MPIGDSPNKLTKDAKAMVQLAFEDLGGVPRLVEWAQEPGNLGIFYREIWSKIIPKVTDATIKGDGGPLTIVLQKFGTDITEEDEPLDAEYKEIVETENPS